MYLGIDVGGTKTLYALLDKKGQMLREDRQPTVGSVAGLAKQAAASYRRLAPKGRVKAVGVGLPAAIDYHNPPLIKSGSLPWLGNDVVAELEQIFKVPVRIANDALLGGWSEATTGAGAGFGVVLYVTLSTGVGTSLIINGRPHAQLLQSEGGQMIVQSQHQTLHRLEDLVSGPAIRDRFGQFGYEISDPAIWEAIARDLSVGLFNMITVIRPQIVVIGGGLGMHFDAYRAPLRKYLEQLNPGFISLPQVRPAANPETAVAYGCYLLAKKGLKG